MCRFDSGTIKLSAKKLMLLNCGVEKTLASPLDCKRSNQSILKEISPGCSLEVEAETLIFWPPDAKSIRKDLDAGKD